MVINCALTKESEYNEATEQFHHLIGRKQLYGFNFTNGQDAQIFARAVRVALENLSSDVPGMSLETFRF